MKIYKFGGSFLDSKEKMNFGDLKEKSGKEMIR